VAKKLYIFFKNSKTQKLLQWSMLLLIQSILTSQQINTQSKPSLVLSMCGNLACTQEYATWDGIWLLSLYLAQVFSYFPRPIHEL